MACLAELQFPEYPTASPRSLIPKASPSTSLSAKGRGSALPLTHNAASAVRLLIVVAEQVASMLPSSANPTTSPRLLIALACPLFPPNVGRPLMCPSRQRNGTHERCVPKPQMSSPFGSGLAVSDIPTASPRSLIPPQLIQLLAPGFPSVPRSMLNP